MSSDSEILLSRVPADGSAIGNIKLMQTLGWDEARYLAARQILLDQGVLLTGKGRGGAVMRASAPGSVVSSPLGSGSAQPLEMFAPEEVAAAAPLRKSAAPAAKAPKQSTSPSPPTSFLMPPGKTSRPQAWRPSPPCRKRTLTA